MADDVTEVARVPGSARGCGAGLLYPLGPKSSDLAAREFMNSRNSSCDILRMSAALSCFPFHANRVLPLPLPLPLFPALR